MDVVVAPDSFRGSLPAAVAAQAICAGLGQAGITGHALPLADGGEGFLEVLLDRLGGRRVDVSTVDALGRPLRAPIGLLPQGIAVVETAVAIGHAPLAGRRDPVAASTEGAGMLIAAALDRGCTQVLVGVGGSATTDGGAGAIAALGARGLGGARVRVACDVRTSFLDAARIFGPQKGATPEDVARLTERLRALSARYLGELGTDVDALTGSGAAGGLAGGLAALGAALEPGFDLVAQAVRLDDALRLCDAVAARLEAEGVHVVTLRALALPGQDPLADAETLARRAGLTVGQRLSRSASGRVGRP